MKARRNIKPRRAQVVPAQSVSLVRRDVLAGALLVAITMVCYARSLTTDYIWDDPDYVINSTTIRSVEGLQRMWLEPRSIPQWYPLVHTTFWIEYHLWQLNPLGYHAVNILLHAGNVLLLWRLLLRLNVPGAWLAAAIFAVHPVEVESVAWITERKNVLSMLFALAAILSYLRFDPPVKAENTRDDGATLRYYVFALLLFVAALLSKTMVATVPAVLLVIYWWKRGRITRNDVWPLLPFFVVGATLGLVTAWLEKYHAGAVGETWNLPLVHRVLIAGRALWFYAGKLAWPYPMIFFGRRWDIDTTVWWQYLFPLAAVATMVGLWLARKRIGRGPLAAVLIFAGTLAPMLGFFTIYFFRYAFVADHFQYHSSVALIALAAAGAALLTARLAPDARGIAKVASATLLLILGGLSFHRTFAYQNLEVLCRDSLAKNPHSWVAYQNLADQLAKRNEHDEAIRYCRLAVEMDPDYSYSHNVLGMQLLLAGHYAEAVEEFDRTIELAPTFAGAFNYRGDALSFLGETERAKASYQRAIELSKSNAIAYCGLGRVLASQGKLEEAQATLLSAARIDPSAWLVHDSLGLVYRDLKKLPEAVAAFSRAIECNPNALDAYMHLAQAHQLAGDPRSAVACLQRAVKQWPQDANLHVALAIALTQNGRRDQAIAELESALGIDPANAKALEQLRALQR